MAVWFTADTHFGDPRVLKLDRRPFPDMASHDEALIANWIDRVADGDEVWHLGDFALGRPAARAASILRRLPGRKHLIIGNNDGEATLATSEWLSVRTYAELDVEGARLVLCHYPFRTWNNMGKGWIDLHGHSHGKLKPIPRQIDVGVDAWDFAPVSLEAVLARSRKRASRAG